MEIENLSTKSLFGLCLKPTLYKIVKSKISQIPGVMMTIDG